MAMRQLLMACLFSAAAHAQSVGTPVEIARTFRIQSRVLGEARTFDVTVPRNYTTGAARFPVLYVLDGELEHEIAAAIARFYAASAQLPPMIVVGVRNTNRMRDMTTPPAAGFTAPGEAGGNGGARKFLDFLATELVPLVDSTYRTAPMRVIVGHSLGGLFALYALAQRPTLFTGYVVMEPSSWWNNQAELEAAKRRLATPEARRVRLMTVNAPALGVDTTRCGGDIPMVREIAVKDETHQSMAAAGVLAALRTMFEDFKPAPWKPGTRPIAMLERYDSLAARVGYVIPIPQNAYGQVARMSIHGRFFDDADRVLDMMQRNVGESGEYRELRQMLATERAAPPDSRLIPLVIPSKRPSPADAARFIGRWVSVDDELSHEIVVRAAGDTIVVHDRVRFPGGIDEGDHQVIQVTSDGTLEWGLPWFRNLPALLVLRGTIQSDGSMRVKREPRGWVPRGPGGDFTREALFRKAP
jgi:predicted alpha/beta superfamily hydrolase